MDGVRILLGVTGSVAAYKSPELIRQLRALGAEVQVVMSESAEHFISVHTLQAVSGRPVRTAMFDPAHEAAMGHIELARWADLILIAPASAQTIAALAHGMADNLMNVLCLASHGHAPLCIAPAMNCHMWSHPATQANVAQLTSRGVTLLGPESGEQACGDVGPGRMLAVSQLVDAVCAQVHLGSTDLSGSRVMITAGPTREPLDPVRFLSNRSTGKMGYALAAAAARAGAQVHLISGPVDLTPPTGVHYESVTTAQEMYDAVMRHVDVQDIFISTAAVADYRPSDILPEKIKKSAGEMQLTLRRNPDILAEAAPKVRFSVGFAAETESVAQYAKEKRARKAVDIMVANDVSRCDAGFGADNNEVTVYWQSGEIQLSLAPKQEIASRLINLIKEKFDEKYKTQSPRSETRAHDPLTELLD